MLRIDIASSGFLNANAVANTPVFTDNSILGWSNNGNINNNVIAHLRRYLNSGFNRGNPGPYEIHPYIIREIASFDLNRKYLVLGTFPPNSYMHNLPAIAPLAALNNYISTPPNVDFFYGNLASFWNLIGTTGPLNKINIIRYLAQNDISISDVILGAQRKENNSADDSRLFNILPNLDIKNIFDNSSKVETILFTSGSLRNVRFYANGLFKIKEVTTLNYFLKILLLSGFQIEISGQTDGNGVFHPFNNLGVQSSILQQAGHIIWWIKFGNKKMRIINLPSPSDRANLTIANSVFFKRWVNWKCTQNVIPTPPINANLLAGFLPGFPTIFTPPFTKQYKSEIYNLALNNLAALQVI
jgi:hypothetical protein